MYIVHVQCVYMSIYIVHVHVHVHEPLANGHIGTDHFVLSRLSSFGGKYTYMYIHVHVYVYIVHVQIRDKV